MMQHKNLVRFKNAAKLGVLVDFVFFCVGWIPVLSSARNTHWDA